MQTENRPKIGLALSGSGNRSSFYVGFFEVLQEHSVPIDYIAASSGGALVAAAYACGTLSELKKLLSTINKETIKSFMVKGSGRGGLYSLQVFEDELRNFTKGLRFEDVRPLMGFITVDIESGEQVVLSMGDIARAACASCTLPGVFEPIKWGGRTLVDGGLSSIIPLDVLEQAGMDLSIGINMRGTKHIFASRYLTVKSVLNKFKKMLFIEELENLFGKLEEDEFFNFENSPSIFTVLGKSLDIALKASKNKNKADLKCDLLITPNIPLHNRKDFLKFSPYYELGRKNAEKYIPQIELLIREKTKALEKV